MDVHGDQEASIDEKATACPAISGGVSRISAAKKCREAIFPWRGFALLLGVHARDNANVR
jgi:hypothetical protein